MTSWMVWSLLVVMCRAAGGESAEDQVVEFEDSNDTDPFVDDFEDIPYRGNIPSFISPLHYGIVLKANLRDWVYSGRTHVLINITEPCDQVPIHSAGLNISDVFMATYEPEGRGRRVPIMQVVEDKNQELLRIYPRRILYSGVYQLFIDFKNEFVSDLFWGFYQSSWTDEKGWKNKMVTTQFSPYWARHAWPCYDEPKYKATFKFFVDHESQYYALSNGAQESREPIRSGWVRTTFERTPEMSTYITAMIITNYRDIKGTTKSGIPVKLYGSHEKLQTSRRMLDTTIKTIDFLEEYFGVEYPMSKLDVVPVRRFGVAAMENWGLITAREDIANFDPTVHSAQWELQARVIMAHEVAHMWFGDLVTPKWWDNIILKESTVSWFMVFAADAIFDDFNFSDEYMVTYELIRGMDKDSSVNSRPAIANPESQDEIMNLFDEITYQRGGNLFRMIYHIMGPAPFKAAIHNYLSENAFNTAQMTDLTQNLQDEAPEYDLKSLIERYTLQKNFPVVHVKMLNRTHILVTQERFLFTNKEAVDDSPYNYTWHIPFTYTTDAERVDKVQILTERENIVELSKPATWIKVNNDFRMYYITNYDLVGWKKLYHQLVEDHTVFTTTDRIQLLSDLLNLVTADKLDITFPLQFLTYMKKETEFGPWKLATEHWNHLINRMSPAEKFAAKIYARDLMDEALKEVVKLNTSYNKPIKERLLQFVLVDTGMTVDHPVAHEFIDKLGELSSATSGEGTEPGIVYLQKLRRAKTDKKYWTELLHTLPSMKNPDDIRDTYWILCDTNNVTALKALLENSLQGSEDTQQEALDIISKTKPEVVWKFFKKNYDRYYQLYGKSQFTMAYLIQIVTEMLNTSDMKNDVKSFFKSNDPGTGEPGMMAGLEQIAENIRWKKNHRHKCRNFFFTYARKHAKGKN
ncbi:endoplasmic reticulum aminopeptidase 2-like isoform X4 [Bolinopsis microptera]|uniref:endoplasmic reticulum aminopeptidase 2-like isoform X4 n=1 Tax=Bolinopsis microptera TaxID=2820187 RepID=UPI00307A491B